MDAAYELSRFIVDITFEDLDQDAIDLAKKEVLDTFANILGGSQDEAARGLYEIVRTWGGREESSVVVYGGKFPAPNAALVNSTMASALAYHDTHERGHLHAASVVVPSAFAVSEAKGNVRGKELITAICAAVELGCRLGIATKSAKPNLLMGGWSYGPLLGHFTAAAVSGKILNLDRQKMHNALGIAYNQVSGNAQCVADAAATERLGYGFASRSGITSSLIAQKGLTGATRIFDETETGFFSMYHAGCNREHLLKDLGRKFEMLDMSFKPYPGCRLCHRYFETALRIMTENGIEVDEVEEITPFVSLREEELCVPRQLKEKPGSTMAAYFSLPWILACGAVRGKLGIEEFTEEALKDPQLLSMAAKVNHVLDRSLPDEISPTRVRIITRRGVFEANTTYPRGSLQNPVNLEDIENKLIKCASTFAKDVPKGNLAQLTAMIRNLEEVEDVGRIIHLVV